MKDRRAVEREKEALKVGRASKRQGEARVNGVKNKRKRTRSEKINEKKKRRG